MTIYTRAQVRANREKAIAFLKEPERKKAAGMLDRGGEERCCLGHMCVALDVPRHGYFAHLSGFYGKEKLGAVAPDELIRMLAMPSMIGEVIGKDKVLTGLPFASLSSVNDKTKMTPQEIGAYLETVIEGGEGTPWIALSDIPEELL